MTNLDLLEEACEKLPHTTRAMFGGHGLFAPNGGMFAGIVTDDEIILKFADDQARGEFEALGGRAWVYDGKMTMREWLVIPDALYDEPRELAAWAARAHKLAPPKKTKKAKPAAAARATANRSSSKVAKVAKKAAPAKKKERAKPVKTKVPAKGRR